MTETQLPTSYPAFRVAADLACPKCGAVQEWLAMPDERPTPNVCWLCACKVWATLDRDAATLRLVAT
jgi:hypothetical protein